MNPKGQIPPQRADLGPRNPVPPAALLEEQLKKKLRAEIEAELAEQQAAAAGAPAGDKVMPAEWPCRGYSGPQPWEASNPPELTHQKGFVASGAAGADVVELAALLDRLGYPTDISCGRNPHAIFGETERAAVTQFRSEWNVWEDPAVVAATIPSVIGPWTWEALYSVVRAAEGAQG